MAAAPDSSERPAAAELAGTDYDRWKRWAASGFGRFDAQQADYFEAELSPHLAGQGAPRVLEIGFGNGSLMGWCLQKRWCYVGMEINPELLRRARQAGVEAHGALSEVVDAVAPASLDAVFAMDVFEHIEHAALIDLLQSLRRLMKPGACLIARFPNGDSPFGRVNQHGDMTHVTTLGRYKVNQLASLVDLELKSIGAPARARPQGAWSGRIKSALAVKLRAAIEIVVGRLYYGQRIALEPNTVAVFRRPPDDDASQ